ncbi:HAD-hyrolase-like protein [Aureococcus anophagefferens]|nr:HAD-hyrolase-like protein [Aureococcus anophagefferens]
MGFTSERIRVHRLDVPSSAERGGASSSSPPIHIPKSTFVDEGRGRGAGPSPSRRRRLAAAEAESAFLGGFGSDFCSGDVDDADRNHRPRRADRHRLAPRRAHASLERLVHVGDAPADVLAARACALEGLLDGDDGPGVVGCVAVGTGKYAPEHLADLAGDAVDGVWDPVVLADGLADLRFLAVARRGI